MEHKEERQGAGPGAKNIVSPANYTAAWQRFTSRADLSRLTSRQATAVILLRIGVADSIEKALRILEAE